MITKQDIIRTAETFCKSHISKITDGNILFTNSKIEFGELYFKYYQDATNECSYDVVAYYCADNIYVEISQDNEIFIKLSYKNCNDQHIMLNLIMKV